MLNASVEVAIGLTLIFLVFSVVVSGVHEGVARALSWRAKTLWAAVRRLVDEPAADPENRRNRLAHATDEGDVRPRVETDDTFAGRLYAHPLIGGLERRAAGARTRIHAIEPSSFARALIDALVPDGDGRTSIDDVRDEIAALPESHPLRRQLLILVSEAGEELDDLREKLEGWFDNQMEALSQGYRRRSKWFMLAIGLGVAVGFNVDAVVATQQLYRDDALRASVVSQAETVVDACTEKTDDALTDCLEEQSEPVQKAVPLPVGWQGQFRFTPSVALGWALSGIALMQGAPFWFDILRRAVGFRRGRNPGGAPPPT